MKRFLFLISFIGLLLGCQGKENPSGGDDYGGGNKVVVATAISLSKSELTLEKGANEVLTVSYTPSDVTNKTVTWVSSNTGIATVTDGVVVAVSPGSTEIIAKCGNASAKCSVTVVISATGISLNKTSLEFKALSQTETLTATVNPPGTTDKLEWVSSDSSIATVADGVVTSVSPGTAEITVKCGNSSAKCTVTVEISAMSISLNKSLLEFKALNLKETLTATVEPANTTDKTEWTSSNSGVATVVNGVVTSISPGSADITVTCGNASAKCSVTVEVAAIAISLNKKKLELEVGSSETLTATVEPANTTDILEWSSSSEDIATVKDGVVTAVTPGNATITAKAGSKTATCDVVVKKPVPEGAVDLGLSVFWASCNLNESGFVSSHEMFGDYYAWGEVEPYYSSLDPLTWKNGKTGYDWASYKWCNGEYKKLTKYCPTDKADYWDGSGEPDGKTVLDPEDDVARVVLGDKWRIPTSEEWCELRDKCTWTVTSMNGVNGRKITGPNGNSIFLPAAGYWDGSNFLGGVGHYWGDLSNSMTAYSAYFTPKFLLVSGGELRCYGGSIRPVTE